MYVLIFSQIYRMRVELWSFLCREPRETRTESLQPVAACGRLNGRAAAPKERIVDSKPWMPTGLDVLMRYDIREMVDSNLWGLPRGLTRSMLGEVGGFLWDVVLDSA